MTAAFKLVKDRLKLWYTSVPIRSVRDGRTMYIHTKQWIYKSINLASLTTVQSMYAVSNSYIRMCFIWRQSNVYWYTRYSNFKITLIIIIIIIDDSEWWSCWWSMIGIKFEKLKKHNWTTSSLPLITNGIHNKNKYPKHLTALRLEIGRFSHSV
jgi:hypothetical protein